MKLRLAIATSMVLLIGLSCKKEPESDIQDLPSWQGRTIQAMIEKFGNPTEEYVYTIGQAPTKGWNHGIIFSIYPKHEPQNRSVVIKEYVWDQNDFEIRACCHLVKEAWIIMGARKIHKGVKF